MIFRRKIALKENTNAGLILGYEISDQNFNPILKLASKGKKGWKKPIFIKHLLSDPTPLIMHERWLYDEISINNALEDLKNKGSKHTDKLKVLFQKSNRFEAINLQKTLNTPDDIDLILGTMVRCQDKSFHESIDPLEKAYGNYAYPNSYEFERMNAGIIRCLSRKFPNIVPLDDSIRAPVYEYLGTKAYPTLKQNINNLDSFLKANHIPLMPMPEFGNNWIPEEFIKAHKSRGADQLREIISNIREGSSINRRDFERYIDRSKAIAESISPTRNIVYAFAGLGFAILSAIQAVSNPIFYIPSVIFTVIAADQVYTTIEDNSRAGQYTWIKVADQLAAWKRSNYDEN